MVRKWIAGVALVVVGLIGPAAIASAETTPPVTVETTVPTEETQDVVPPEVLGTSSEIAAVDVAGTSNEIEVLGQSSSISGALSYTGVNFNVPLTIAIGALVVLAGAGLIFAGSRGLFRVQRTH